MLSVPASLLLSFDNLHIETIILYYKNILTTTVFPKVLCQNNRSTKLNEEKRGKMRIHNLKYGLRRQGRKMFIIYLSSVCLMDSETSSIHMDWLQISN